MLVSVIILSIICAFFEATLLPTLRIAGGTIQLGTIIITTVMLFGSLRYSSIFLLLSAIMLAIFTAMPITYFLLPNFVVLSILLILINRRILSRPITLVSFFIFFLAVIVADLIKIIMLAGFSLYNLYTVLPDALYSAIIATILYYLINKFFLYFNPQILREEIKMF